MTAVLSALQAGRVWFARRPQFIGSHRADMWHCGGMFCEWYPDRQRWGAWTHRGEVRFGAAPAAALSHVGYRDPEVTP